MGQVASARRQKPWCSVLPQVPAAALHIQQSENFLSFDTTEGSYILQLGLSSKLVWKIPEKIPYPYSNLQYHLILFKETPFFSKKCRYFDLPIWDA